MTKGLKLTKEFIQKLAMQKDDIFDINECIEPFVSFDWNGFTQQEFFHLIDSFKNLMMQGVLIQFPIIIYLYSTTQT